MHYETPSMVSITEARELILNRVATLPAEDVPLLDAAGRVLASHVTAPFDIPTADNSAMDGYAFATAAWTGKPLRTCGTLPAGEVWRGPVAAGEAVRIMTGAPLPAGCDTVVPLEETVTEGDAVRFTGEVTAGSHVRRRGEEIRAGERVLLAGALLRPQEIALLASLGNGTATVFRRPRVAIIATGDELQEPGSHVQTGRIFDCNSSGIAAQVMEAGGVPLRLGIAGDDAERTREMIRRGLDADLVITSGGVSVGDRDHVKDAIGQLGGKLLFWRVNMKPGKPVAGALIGRTPLVALPGNPVAALVAGELFVRPALLRMAGHRRIFRPRVTAILDQEIYNRGSRPHLVRCIVEYRDGCYHAVTTGEQGSARLTSLTTGNAILHSPPGTRIPAGTAVELGMLGRGTAAGWETPWP